MAHPPIRAFIDNGPRAGETFMIDAAEDGSAPQEIELVDPALPPMQFEESASGLRSVPGRSRYRLTGFDEERGAYVFVQMRPGD